MNNILNITYTLALAFLLAVGVAVLIGGPVWLLWNWIIPSIFGLPNITFLQAVGLHLLTSILFKNNMMNTVKKESREVKDVSDEIQV
jgi:hypothetical protein